MRWDIGSAEQFSPRDAMRVLQAEPQRFFPFQIQGCSKFTNGAECVLQTGKTNLSGYIPVPSHSVGLVGVDTSPTTVRFTVIGRDYFDAPGSTIKFSTVEQDGRVFLVQDADGHGANVTTILGVKVGQVSRVAWSLQSDALREAMQK